MTNDDTAATTATEKIDELISTTTDWRGEQLGRIRELIHAAVPDVVEEWKWMGSPVWSHDGHLLVGNAHKEKVKLTFPQGAHLADPGGLFNNGLDGKAWRAIDLHEGDTLDADGSKSLVAEAARYNAEKAEAKAKKPKRTTKKA